MQIMTEHFESRATLAAAPDAVFAYVDDPAHLAGHMAKRSWAMAGGRMELGLDAGAGQQVGSRIRLAGRVLGLELSVDEKVVERTPPYRKAWETFGSPKLLVAGRVFGRAYARWCTERMVSDAVRHFATLRERE